MVGLTGKLKPKKIQTAEERAAAQMLEDGFSDFYAHRARVYKVNFIRGIFFGLGSVLGGTIVIAIIIAIFSTIARISPSGIADLFQWVVDTLSRR